MAQRLRTPAERPGRISAWLTVIAGAVIVLLGGFCMTPWPARMLRGLGREDILRTKAIAGIILSGVILAVLGCAIIAVGIVRLRHARSGGTRGEGDTRSALRALRKPSDRALRTVVLIIGLLMTLFGLFCLTPWPEQLIIKYLSHDEILNPETIAAIILCGVFFLVLGWTTMAIALFWPRLIYRAARQPRPELLYGLSLFGTNILLFFGFALGIRSLIAYRIIIILVFVGIALLFIERKARSVFRALYLVLFNRWVAFPGYILASLYFFKVRFPLDTWREFLFNRDYPMFQYTAWLDAEMVKQGFPYGWEPYFSGGYPSFLNLRSILIPLTPFMPFGPALGFHLMIFAAYASVPYLLYWLAKVISDDHDTAIMAGWAGVGAMTGFMWHILNWGMMPTFTSIPLMLLALAFLIKAIRGSRWGAFLSALFWAPVAYIHLGHWAHVGIILFIAALAYTLDEKSLRAGKVLTAVTALTLLLAAPYLILFAHYREHVILTNMFEYPASSGVEMVRMFFLTVSRFIPTLIWDWRGIFDARAFADYQYFSLFTIWSLVVLYLLLGGDRKDRKAAILYAGAIAVSAMSFVPKLELSFQRMLYMVPPLMALALGFWMARGRKRGHVVPMYVFVVLTVFLTRTWWLYPKPVPTIPERGAFDTAVLEKMKDLGGNYIVFENTATLVPYADREKEFEHAPEQWDVHAEGFLRLATGKRLFAHPGYNPHPYYDMRDTYIATGTFNGRDLTEYEPAAFRVLWRKWGIEYLVLWSKAAKRYFGEDDAYEKVLDGEWYSIYRLKGADPRAVVTEGGSGEVKYPGNFSAVVALKDVPAGSRVVLRATYFPEWHAECDGKPVRIENADGQMAFAAPSPDCAVRLTWPKYRRYFIIPLAALALGVFLSARRLI